MKPSADARLKASIEELARFGCPVDLSVVRAETENDPVEFAQCSDVHLSQVFELPHGQIAYMINMAITNHRARTLDIIDVELRPPWHDSIFQWLLPVQVNPPTKVKSLGELWVYRFPNQGQLEFEFDQVLNHRLIENGRLPGHRRFEGWLLATGGMMPEELRHGQPVNVPLVLTTADHREHSDTLRLYADRLNHGTKKAKARTKLFANPPGTNTAPLRGELGFYRWQRKNLERSLRLDPRPSNQRSTVAAKQATKTDDVDLAKSKVIMDRFLKQYRPDLISGGGQPPSQD